MSVEFITTKQNIKTCSVNGIKLHSAYNPQSEAQRFADTIDCPFNPKYILVTEPALSYCVEPIRKRFSETKLCAVRFCKDFCESDNLWDKVFYLTKENFAEELYNYFGDEGSISCYFISWTPCQKAFPEEYNLAWSEIKKCVLKSRNVLQTRSYFAKRWTKNALRFCMFATSTGYIQKGNMPVVVCASGPSLYSVIDYLKDKRDKYFIIAVSSALSPLVKNKIIPDLCVTTDGGYWAKCHLTFGLEDCDVPVALSLESALFAPYFEKKTIIPLSYGDGIESSLLNAFNLNPQHAFRNGTVSGTAVQLALDITTSYVLTCGLDLSPSKSFAHTQPNELENNDNIRDFRLCTKETRITPSTFHSPSLKIYEDWFCNMDFNSRVYRLSHNYSYKNKLGQIADIDISFAEKLYQKEFSAAGHFYKTQIIKNKNTKNICDKKSRLLNIIDKSINTQEWIHTACPLQSIIYERSIGLENEESAKLQLQKKLNEFSIDIKRSIDL